MKTETVEHAYLMDRSRLLLLLSLVDSRPVFGVSLELQERQEEKLQADDWKQVALSLMQSGQLVYTQGRLSAAPGIRELLLAMKDAEGVLVLYEPTGAVEVLYLGSPVVSLTLSGRDGCILRMPGSAEQVPSEKAREALLEEWLTARLPGDGVLPEETGDALEQDPDTVRRIRELERCALPFGQPPFAWGKNRGVQAVADLYDRTGRLQSRHIWTAPPPFPAVLRQDSRDCHACLDTRVQRSAFLQECLDLCPSRAAGGTGWRPAGGEADSGELPDAEWRAKPEKSGYADGEGEATIQ